jgi:acetylglutamate kinase
MDVVDMVLGGKVNKQLTRRLFAHGVEAAGISGVDGGTVIGEAIGPNTRTGKPKEIRTGLVSALISRKLIPVVSPVSMDSDGNSLNINADEVALALSAAMKAGWLIFIADVPGILKAGEPIAAITPEEAEAEISGGVITDGMIPKVRACAGALHDGVERVVIGGYEKIGDLQKLLSGDGGTTIYRKDL